MEIPFSDLNPVDFPEAVRLVVFSVSLSRGSTPLSDMLDVKVHNLIVRHLKLEKEILQLMYI